VTKTPLFSCLSTDFVHSIHPTPHSCYQKRVHLFFFTFSSVPGTSLHTTAVRALSKTFFKPLRVKAEHSKYLMALISLHSFCPKEPRQVKNMGVMREKYVKSLPSSGVIGCFLFFCNSSRVFWSSRRSILVPTKMIGVCGQ